MVKIGKPATVELINALKNPEKTAASHIILTRIYENKKNKRNIGAKYIYKNCWEQIGWHRVFNGIYWDWSSKKGNSIPQNQIEIAYNYWNNKILLNAKTEIPANDEVFDKLEKKDNAKYPCNKTYENNSAEITFENLKKVIGLKLTNYKLEKLMNLLGNDTTNTYFEKNYFIENGADGIEFEFAANDSLINIFIREKYKGTLWGGMKMKFKKGKFKKPDEKSSAGGERIRYIYEKENIEIVFDSESSIKYIILGK